MREGRRPQRIARHDGIGELLPLSVALAPAAVYHVAGAWKSRDEIQPTGISAESKDILDQLLEIKLFQPDLLLRLRAPLTFLNVISVVVFAFNSYISPGNQSFLLPVEPFVASTVVLGILLAHRLKAANDRFIRGREAWRDIISVSRNLNREAHLLADRDSFLVFSRWLEAFPFALLWQLRDMDLKELESLLKVLTEREINQVLTRPPGTSAAGYVLQRLQATTSKLQLPPPQEHAVREQLLRLQDAHRRCEAEKEQAVPDVLQRSAGLLFLWLALLPFIVPTQQVGVVLVQQLLAFGLLGVEDVAIQLEEPFELLQMEGPCATMSAECQALQNNWRRMRKGLHEVPRKARMKYPVLYPRNDRIFPCYPEQMEANGDDEVILL